MPTLHIVVEKGDEEMSLSTSSPTAITVHVEAFKGKPLTTYQLSLTDEGLILEEITADGEFGETLSTVQYDEHSDHREEES